MGPGPGNHLFISSCGPGTITETLHGFHLMISKHILDLKFTVYKSVATESRSFDRQLTLATSIQMEHNKTKTPKSLLGLLENGRKRLNLTFAS